jgi:hypothetical protein
MWWEKVLNVKTEYYKGKEMDWRNGGANVSNFSDRLNQAWQSKFFTYREIPREELLRLQCQRRTEPCLDSAVYIAI